MKGKRLVQLEGENAEGYFYADLCIYNAGVLTSSLCLMSMD